MDTPIIEETFRINETTTCTFTDTVMWLHQDNQNGSYDLININYDEFVKLAEYMAKQD